MKFCPECGHKLLTMKSESNWEEIKDCWKCNIRYKTVFGDVMGGSSDQTYRMEIPPEEVQYICR
jgi:DNA-directed RNA polymerase subunit M/transcription elongation factor TFIIS